MYKSKAQRTVNAYAVLGLGPISLENCMPPRCYSAISLAGHCMKFDESPLFKAGYITGPIAVLIALGTWYGICCWISLSNNSRRANADTKTSSFCFLFSLGQEWRKIMYTEKANELEHKPLQAIWSWYWEDQQRLWVISQPTIAKQTVLTSNLNLFTVHSETPNILYFIHLYTIHNVSNDHPPPRRNKSCRASSRA